MVEQAKRIDPAKLEKVVKLLGTGHLIEGELYRSLQTLDEVDLYAPLVVQESGIEGLLGEVGLERFPLAIITRGEGEDLAPPRTVAFEYNSRSGRARRGELIIRTVINYLPFQVKEGKKELLIAKSEPDKPEPRSDEYFKVGGKFEDDSQQCLGLVFEERERSKDYHVWEDQGAVTVKLPSDWEEVIGNQGLSASMAQLRKAKDSLLVGTPERGQAVPEVTGISLDPAGQTRRQEWQELLGQKKWQELQEGVEAHLNKVSEVRDTFRPKEGSTAWLQCDTGRMLVAINVLDTGGLRFTFGNIDLPALGPANISSPILAINPNSQTRRPGRVTIELKFGPEGITPNVRVEEFDLISWKEAANVDLSALNTPGFILEVLAGLRKP